jgi:hypothetical protein
MNKRLKWVILPFVWLVTTAVLLELALRLAVPVLPSAMQQTARRVMTGRPYVEGYNPSWLDDIEHYRIMKPGLDNLIQYGSPSVSFHVTTISLWGGRIGFRTRPIDYFVDAVAVGDSFTFCFTEIEDCWVTILERETGLGLVNLGQPVTGSISRRRILETYGTPLKPPLVIWEFFANDFNDDYGLAVLRGDIAEVPDLPDMLPPPSLPPIPPLVAWLEHNSVLYSLVEAALTGRWGGMNEIDLIHYDPYRVTYHDGALEFGRYIDRMSADMSRPRNQAGMQLSRQAFQEARALVDSWGGQMVVVLIPLRELVYEHLTAPYLGEDGLRAFGSSYQAMLDLCAELVLTCLDALPRSRNTPGSASTVLHRRPQPACAPPLAQIMADWLTELGYCRKPSCRPLLHAITAGLIRIQSYSPPCPSSRPNLSCSSPSLSAYFAAPHRFRWIVLLASGYFFCGWSWLRLPAGLCHLLYVAALLIARADNPSAESTWRSVCWRFSRRFLPSNTSASSPDRSTAFSTLPASR